MSGLHSISGITFAMDTKGGQPLWLRTVSGVFICTAQLEVVSKSHAGPFAAAAAANSLQCDGYEGGAPAAAAIPSAAARHARIGL